LAPKKKIAGRWDSEHLLKPRSGDGEGARLAQSFPNTSGLTIFPHSETHGTGM
jgi:hypothetical protein